MTHRSHPFRAALAVALLVTTAGVASAEVQPGEIKGQGVMEDTNKSGNDGWSQAPVPREESAGKNAPNPGGNSTEMNRNRSVSDKATTDNPKVDPQTPLDHRTASPSGANPAQPTK